MRLSTLGAVATAAWMITIACGSGQAPKEPSDSTGGAGGEPAEGGSGGRGARGGSGSGAKGGGAGEAGTAGNSQGGTAGEAGTGGTGDTGSGGTGDTGSGGKGGGGDVCAGCPSDVCLEDGTCVECVNNEHCAEPSPFCETGEHVCVECLPDDDQCPAGSYCASNFSCVPGCNAGAMCASGSCLSNHDCDRCISDAECIGGRVCATGICMAPCTDEGQSCGNGRTCCSGRCVDTSRDVAHCGACDTSTSPHACESDAFCGTMGCAGATIANLCQNARAALVRDDFPADNAAGVVLGDALGGCASPPVVRSVSQNVLDVSNPSTGQPIAGSGELVVVSGGPFGQLVARFLQEQRIAAIRHVAVDGRYELQRSIDDTVVASMPTGDATATHDLFVIEVVRDPLSGTFVFIVAGFDASGTGAGAWYFQTAMLPALSTFTKSWYVYEWTDGGDAQVPDASDTFTLLGEAP